MGRGEFAFHGGVVAGDGEEHQHEQRDEQHHDPRAVTELGEGDDERGDARGDGPGAIDDEAAGVVAGSLRQCRTMPACESVKAMNAPSRTAG